MDFADSPSAITKTQRVISIVAGELAPIEGFPFLCPVLAPYARSKAVEEEEALMELHPYAALLGTRSEDWEGVPLVRGRVADSVFNRRIHWHRLVGNRIFGTFEYDYHGYPVRVTTPERTLLDCLLHPDWCGGFVNVLRQRTGFLMEELGLRHPALDLWYGATEASEEESLRFLLQLLHRLAA